MKNFRDVLSGWFDKEFILHWDVQVTLLDKKTKLPIGGEGFEVRFYDQDSEDNDFLGSGPLSSDGVADVRFHPHKMQKGKEGDVKREGQAINDEQEEKFETRPDIFFKIVKDGKVIYTSKTIYDVDFEMNASFDLADGKEINLGTFLVPLE